jgi:hypothetical protein
MDRIITISSLTIDLDRVRAINVNNFSNLGKTNILTIEYNSKVEYSKNPFTNEIEKNILVDTISKEFPDFETAQLYQIELIDCWKDYLAEKSN